MAGEDSLDVAHVEAYTVICLGLIQGVLLIWRRPLSRRDGCAACTCLDTGGGRLPPWAMFAVRASIFAYVIGLHVRHCIIGRLGWAVNRFYTSWNWILLGVYFAVAARESWSLMSAGKGALPRVGMSGQASIALFHVCTTAALLVDAVTWTVLVPMMTTHNPDPEMGVHFTAVFHSFISYNQHGANLLFMLLDLAVNNIPFFPHMLGYLQLLSTAFGVWANIYFYISGTWLYPFLDTSKPWAWEAYLGLFVAHWAFYLIFCTLHKARDMMLGKPLTDKVKAG